MSEDTAFYKGAVAGRDLDRDLSRDMTPAEYRIASRLIALTLEFDKIGVNLSWDRLLNGCEINGVYFGRLGISRSTGKRAVARLVAKNFCSSTPLQFKSGAIGARYTIQADWDDDNQNWEWNMKDITLPKRMRQNEPTPSSDWTDPRSKMTCRVASEVASAEARGTTPTGAVPAHQSLARKISTHHTGPVKKKEFRSPTAASCEKIWREGIADTYDGLKIAAWLPKDKVIFKNTILKEVADPHEFIAWVATSWSRIIKSKFDWMKKPPTMPTLRVLCQKNLRQQFYEAYADRDREQWLRGQDWMSIERTMEIYGIGLEEATLKVAEKKATHKLASRIRESEEEAEQTLRVAEAARENTRRELEAGRKELARREENLGRQSKGLPKEEKPVYNAYEDPDFNPEDQEALPEYEPEPYQE